MENKTRGGFTFYFACSWSRALSPPSLSDLRCAALCRSFWVKAACRAFLGITFDSLSSPHRRRPGQAVCSDHRSSRTIHTLSSDTCHIILLAAHSGSFAPWEEFLHPNLHLLCPSDLPGDSFKDLSISGAEGRDDAEGVKSL